MPPNSRYSAYLDQLPHQATAEDFEKWAREHPEDTGAVEALVDAGWEWSIDGEYARALALFSEALELGGGHRGPARIGIADQLCKLDRRDEAQEVLQAVRGDLETSPEPEWEMYAEAAGLLEECGEFTRAVEWCEAGLARAAEWSATDRGAGTHGGLTLRERLLICRWAARRELGLATDARDEEAARAEEHGLRAFRARLGPSPGDQRPFDGLLLYWPAEEFPEVIARWPWSGGAGWRIPGGGPGHAGHAGVRGIRAGPVGDGGYGLDHDAYRRRVQTEAERHAAAGAPHVLVVSGNVEEYARYAARAGQDPGQPETLRAYQAWRHHEHPELSVRWPPPRNGPCWCGSGRAYKECCVTTTPG